MALSVTAPYQTPYGTTVQSTYWLWVNLAVDVPSLQASCTLYGYVDEAAFNTNKQPIGNKQFVLQGDDFAQFVMQPVSTDSTVSDALSSIIYAYAKASDPLFTNATEV
jgi:hypothetical protein